MGERVKRMLKKECLTEDIRLWAGMAHRVVELTGTMDTPEDLRIELFLHDDSAFRLLDMCDAIDERFEAIRTENKRLRELARDLVALPAVPAFDCFGCRYEKHTDCGGGCMLVRRARELGIEVEQ